MTGEAPPGTEIEYKVVGMRGHPPNSGVYGTATLDSDALAKVKNVQAARGGTLLRRYVTRSEWEVVGRQTPPPSPPPPPEG